MPYRIALLSKYPPLEGGIAAKTYWLARGLAAHGHDVHVITNEVSAGGEYAIAGAVAEGPVFANLRIHRIPDDIPWHIPEDREYALRLLDLAEKTVKEHSIQILDTGYLIPYGIVGHLTKASSGVKLVIRHGGSDLEKFLKRRVLETLICEVISHADAVITETRYQDLFKPIASRVFLQPAYVPDDSAFTPSGAPHSQYRLAVIGKINYLWEMKGLHLVAKIMDQLAAQFECLVVGQGKGVADFQRKLGSDTVTRLKWRPFVAPWEMPNLLNQLDGVFIFESGLPHPVVSNLALEAISSGVGIITDRADFKQTYREIIETDKNRVITVCPSDPSSVEVVARWIENRNPNAKPLHRTFTFEDYIVANEAIYSNILDH